MIAVALVACALNAAALIAMALVASFALRKASAAVRHFVWVAAIVGVCALPLFQAIPFHWNSAKVANGSPLHRPNTVAAPAQVSSFVVDAIDSLPRHETAARWMVALWAAGVALMSVRLLAAWIAVEQMRRRARPCAHPSVQNQAERCAQVIGTTRPVRVLIANAPYEIPSTFGLLRPVVLLPAGCTQWTAQRMRIVLLHEMSHIRRQDWATGILAQVCVALYWFHPLVWMAARRLREESECAADDLVLVAGEDASTYAEELLNIIRGAIGRPRVPASAIAMASFHQLERRITMMLNETTDRRRATRKAMLLTTMAALAALVPLSAVRSTAQSSTRFEGTVLDPRGSAVAAATVIATNRETRSRDMTATDAAGMYHFDSLPVGNYEVRILKPGFAEHREDSGLPASGSASRMITLEMGALSETINVVANGSGSTADSTAPQRIVVGGQVQAANLIRQIKPAYPESAKAAGVQGAVILEASIGMDGVPTSLQIMNPHIDADLARAAVEAVNQWRYRPTLLNGQPVEVRTNITVKFTLSN